MDERPDFDEDPAFFENAKEVKPQDSPGFSTPLVESDVLTLMHLGAIEKTFEWGGHTFTMRTPKANGELAIAQIVSDYEGPMAQGRALMVAEIAASLEMVDNRQLYASITNDEPVLTQVRKKFYHIMERWHWPVIEIVHSFWKDIQIRQIEAIQELSEKSEAGRSQS